MVTAIAPPAVEQQVTHLVVRFRPLFEMTPDASWVQKSRLALLTAKQKERFMPLCPDFVVEVASPSDSLAELQAKMDEYMANGAQLGWLLVPATRTAHIYRPGEPATSLADATTIAGDPVLPGFTLDLGPVWEPVL
jgi:Uma2 family endonuclease